MLLYLLGLLQSAPYNILQLSLLLPSLNAPFLIKCYYRPGIFYYEEYHACRDNKNDEDDEDDKSR